MINKLSFQAIDKATFSQRFIKPLYDTYCFSNIPQTIKNLLLNEQKKALPTDVLGNFSQNPDKVIVLLVDGFGWQIFEKYAPKYPFLQRLINKGIVSKLTTQFPSTTPVQVTTINTGLPVGEHGIYEWNYYEPEVDALISPLLFSFAGNAYGKRVRNTLLDAQIDPKKIFPNQTIYKELKENNVDSYAFLQEEYAHSPYTSVVCNGANIIAYTTFQDAIQKLLTTMTHTKKKTYYYVYINQLDSLEHHYGPTSQQFEEAVDNFFNSMENDFFQNISGLYKDTLFIMTADHGQVAINPQKTIYLNKEFPQILSWIKTNKSGQSVVPAGACRDMFLHIKDAHLDQAYNYLQEQLKGKAEVYKVSELITLGFFGPSVAQKFRQRVGNLVILCYDNNSVWWYEKGKFEITYKGHHGSMTPAEMETYFACMNLG